MEYIGKGHSQRQAHRVFGIRLATVNKWRRQPFSYFALIKDNERIEYLQEVEVKRFLDTLAKWPSKNVANMLLLALYTGMRRGEIFKLQTGDIDFDMRIINIRSPKGGKSTAILLFGTKL